MTELERALVALGRELDVPEAPDLASAVRARLEPRLGDRPVRRRALVAALVVLALLAATLAIPEARSALLRVLHVGGASIETVDQLPEVAAQPDLGLTLGRRVTLEEARSAAGFELRELGRPPDAVYLGDRGTVWLLYGTPERPRLLVAETPRTAIDQELFLKKLAGPGTRVEPVTVDGSLGVYLGGNAHFLLLLDELGNPVEESARLARDVLLWDDDRIAFRLEGDFGRDRALELAGSLRTVS